MGQVYQVVVEECNTIEGIGEVCSNVFVEAYLMSAEDGDVWENFYGIDFDLMWAIATGLFGIFIVGLGLGVLIKLFSKIK